MNGLHVLGSCAELEQSAGADRAHTGLLCTTSAHHWSACLDAVVLKYVMRRLGLLWRDQRRMRLPSASSVCGRRGLEHDGGCARSPRSYYASTRVWPNIWLTSGIELPRHPPSLLIWGCLGMSPARVDRYCILIETRGLNHAAFGPGPGLLPMRELAPSRVPGWTSCGCGQHSQGFF